MPDWLIEEGIGETRAVRLSHGRIVQAHVEWDDRLQPGWIVEGKLIARTSGENRGTALAGDEEILVDRLPRDLTEGSPLRLEIGRAALDGPGHLKRARARISDLPVARPTLAARLSQDGNSVRVVRRFETDDWDELIDEALSGEASFAGGSLLLAPAAAFTAIDVDGALPPVRLALAAVPAVAAAVRRLDLAGSIAIDFPTLQDKADRKAVDTALGDALENWPHERTAMNGFGLVQIVARATRPSLLQLANWRRASMVWRRVLRRAEHLEGAGLVELTISPRLAAVADTAHLAELERRTGRPVRLREDPALALDAPHAQLVSHA